MMKQDAGSATEPLRVGQWRLKSGRLSALHVSPDGVTTGCGQRIPPVAQVSAPDPEWFLHGRCYNCFHRLWPQYGPKQYIQPHSSSQFPPTRKCPHNRHPQDCPRCTPNAAQNWPCPNGCTDPVDHDPINRYTACTRHPPRREPGADGRCVGVCETTEAAMRRANPKLFFDLADSASMYCYHCEREMTELWDD